MEISALLLARAQFALSLNFHVLFAALAMALGWLLCVFRHQAWRTEAPVWMSAYRFWVRIFALVFFLALASSVPVLLELGILWPPLIERIGNVAGPLIAFAITTLFVIKSVFLGVMFFGQRRVSAGAHVLSVFMVALGLTLTIFWELVMQSWTHTPAGATLIDGIYQVDDWSSVILNPSLHAFLLLYVAGSFLAVGCVMTAVASWQAGRRPLEDHERLTYRTGVVIVILASTLQLFALDTSLRQTAHDQPVTAAAVMGYWQTGSQPELMWLDWERPAEPLADSQETLDPAMTHSVSDSLAMRWLGQDAEQKWIGLDQADAQTPSVKTLFTLARLVAYGAVSALCLMLLSVWTMFRRGADPGKYSAWLLRAQVWLGLLGTGVWLCAWNLTELGLHPFMVWATLRQEDLLTTAGAGALAAGVLASGLVYAILFRGFIKMLFHAARYGVVPVRKPGVRI
jgi:cytochrome d ubiquinol oxidase subunit I